MTLRVAFKSKQSLQGASGGAYSLWRYQMTLDKTVTKGELGLGFSSRIDIQDPLRYPDVPEVQGTSLIKGSDPVQFVSVDVASAHLEVLDIYLIAPDASDSFTPVTLAVLDAEHGTSQELPFTAGLGTQNNITQVLEGPAAGTNQTSPSPTTEPGAPPPKVLPYASEPFGVYQPLIGWRGALQHDRIADATARRFVRAANMIGGVAALTEQHPISMLHTLNATDRTGTLIGRQLASEVLAQHGGGVEADALHTLLANTHDSALTSVTRNVLTTLQQQDGQTHASTVRSANQRQLAHSAELQTTAEAQITREAATATLLHYLGQTAPAVISQMFKPSVQPWERVVAAAQWFAENHPAQAAFLSPIGLLHLFREYFFELGTFLGPPVGHVWLSPGGTVELVEVNTRRTLVEQTIEQSTETVQKTELSQTDQDELSDAVKVENANDTKLGVTASASGGVEGVYQASGSASFNLDASRKQAQEQTHKRMREQSSKLSSEVRQNYNTTFRTVTETTDTSSRRYVLQNTTSRLVSYELSRKMRKVAVQVQDLGQQLCWQLYIDNPGDTLGLGEFVHATAAALDPVKPPDYQSSQNQSKTYQLSLPFILTDGGDTDASEIYTPEDGNRDHGIYETGPGKHNDIIQFKFDFPLPPPPAGFELSAISQIDFHGAQISLSTNDGDLLPNPNKAKNSFSIRLTYANFGGKQSLPFDATLEYVPTDDTKKQIDAANAALKQTYDDQVAAAKEKSFYETLRTRLKLLGKVTKRPEEDLREEERSIIYRNIISRLYGSEAGWTNDEYHVASELIRYLFDVDAMLYFVAPDWWRPRAQPLVSKYDQSEFQPTIIAEPAISFLVEGIGTSKPTILPGHRPYYQITEETAPAPMGASLGWLIQLDGDTHRNAFLNSPWVKAVLPIRPGRERDAILWLQRPEVAGTDGLSEPYPFDPAQDPPEYRGRTIKDVLLLIADKIAVEYNNSLKPGPNDKLALPSETVFTHGFDPLENGIEFGKGAFEVFSQWIEILPTDQVVATEYSLEGLTG